MTSTPTWCIKNRGSFASLHVILPPGTSIHCETDAVVTFSGAGVAVRGVLQGGFLTSIFRALFGGESFFTTVVENNALEEPGDVMLAPADPGGIELHPVTTARTSNGGDLLLTSGAYVASDAGVKITTELQSRMRNSLLSGTGLFLLRASGRGTVACAAYGSIHKFELRPGEQRAVDNGHLVAWTANMNYRTGLANRGGLVSSITSGEGLMCHFTGPGIIYLQSHKPSADPDTVIRKGKSGAKTTVQAGIVVYGMLIMFLLVVATVFYMLVSNNMMPIYESSSNYNGYNDGRHYDNYDGYSSSRRSSSQRYRATREL